MLLVYSESVINRNILLKQLILNKVYLDYKTYNINGIAFNVLRQFEILDIIKSKLSEKSLL